MSAEGCIIPQFKFRGGESAYINDLRVGQSLTFKTKSTSPKKLLSCYGKSFLFACRVVLIFHFFCTMEGINFG